MLGTFLFPITTLGLGGVASLNLGVVLAALTIPLWLSAAVEFRGARLLQILMLAAVLGGGVLLAVSVQSHAFEVQRALGISLAMVLSPVALGFLLWARQLIGLAPVGLLYGFGALIDNAVRFQEWGENGWKYGYSWAVAVILLSLVIGLRREKLATAAVFLALAIPSVLGGYRTLMVFCVVALALFLFMDWNRRQERFPRIPLLLGLVVGCAAFGYAALTWLSLSGLLGHEVQTKSEHAIRETGSVLVGGRTEWSATLALMKERFFGFGPGVIPSEVDIEVGKQGLAGIGANPESQHANTYIFDGQFRLHSIFGDLWTNFGIPGLVLAIAAASLATIALIRFGDRDRASGLQILLALWLIWDIAFSPFDSNWRYDVFALALLLGWINGHGDSDFRSPFEVMQRSSLERRLV